MRYRIKGSAISAGSEYVNAEGVNVNEGTLLLFDTNEDGSGILLVKAFAPNSWSSVEAAPE